MTVRIRGFQRRYTAIRIPLAGRSPGFREAEPDRRLTAGSSAGRPTGLRQGSGRRMAVFMRARYGFIAPTAL